MAQKAIKVEELGEFLRAGKWDGVDRLLVPIGDAVTVVIQPGTTVKEWDSALTILDDTVGDAVAEVEPTKKSAAKAAK